MKVKELLKTEICYFYFDTSPIPFSEIGMSVAKKYGYARILNQQAYLGYESGYYLYGVYDFFSDIPIKDINEIKNHDFIMNQKLCFHPYLRGAHRWTFIASEPMATLNIPGELPHMSGSRYSGDEDIVSYFKNGIYAPGIGPYYKAEFKYLKHLEDGYIISPNNIMYHLYIELLKQNYTSLSDDELLDKLKCIDGGAEWNTYEEYEKKSIYKDFKRLFNMPIYRDIPVKYRERAINEIENISIFKYNLTINPSPDFQNCTIYFNLPDFPFDEARVKIIRMPETLIFDQAIDKESSSLNIDTSEWTNEYYYNIMLLIDGGIKDSLRYIIRS